MNFSSFETDVMKLLLSGDDPEVNVLRDQFSQASLMKRELTGVGFFIYFDLPYGIKKLQSMKSFTIRDVQAQIEGLAHGAGFLLFIDNGVIHFLEGYCYDESWPKEIKKYYLKKEKIKNI